MGREKQLTTPCSGCEPAVQHSYNSEILSGWLTPVMVNVRRDMSPETKDLLRRFDEPGAYEFPAKFDYPDLERRAKLVCEDIEGLQVRVGFEGAGYNQDASFSIALLLHTFERTEASTLYQPTVRFSNFGNLATITWSDRIPEAVTKEIQKSLQRHGFTFVDAGELDSDYDGVMADKKNTFQTWWIRYFDWI